MNDLKKSFILELMNDIKNYRQMPAFWSNGEKNFSIGVGYCFSCDAIKGLTKYRKRFLGNDCLGSHYETDSVPFQCFDSWHEGVIEFSPVDFDSFLKFIQFFKDNKNIIKDIQFKEGETPNVKINNATYKVFRSLVDSWEDNEIGRMHNPDYINTDEFAKLVEDYEKWHSFGKRGQIQEIEFLHKTSLEYLTHSKKFNEEISPLRGILSCA